MLGASNELLMPSALMKLRLQCKYDADTIKIRMRLKLVIQCYHQVVTLDPCSDGTSVTY